MTEQHEKKVKEQESEVAKLRAALEEALAAAEASHEKKRKKPKPNVGDDHKVEKWREKYKGLEEKFDDLQHERDRMERQIRMLLDKLKAIGDEEVATCIKHWCSSIR